MTETTATIKLAGVERTVELDILEGRAWVTGVASVIGRGTKHYPDMLTLWAVSGERPARPGNKTVIDSEGQMWQFHLRTCVRNRPARIVGWAEVVGIDNRHDQTRV